MKTSTFKISVLCLALAGFGIALVTHQQIIEKAKVDQRSNDNSRRSAENKPVIESDKFSNFKEEVVSRNNYNGNNGSNPYSARDLLLLKDPMKGTPQEFRECLERHFPLDALVKGDMSEGVVNELRREHALFTAESNAVTPDGYRASVALMLGGYPLQMLRPDCPRQEREIFCRLVDAFMQLYTLYPDEQMYTAFLGQIFADYWTGWGEVPTNSSEVALKKWHSSEIYQYLLYNVPPSSSVLSARVGMMKN